MKEDLIGNFKKIMYMKQVTTSRREKHSAQKMEKIARTYSDVCTDCYSAGPFGIGGASPFEKNIDFGLLTS